MRLRSRVQAAAPAVAVAVVVASCGARTALFDTPPVADASVEAAADARPEATPVEASFDAGPPGVDATTDGRLDAPAEAHDAGHDADAFPPPPDATPDVPILTGAVSCADSPGLQPGSPWPVPWRCPSHGGYTSALGPTSNPHVAWQVDATESWAMPVVAADGTIYSVDGARGVVALAPDGTTRWSTAIGWPGVPTPGAAAMLAIGVDGTVYAWTGTLTAVRPDGSVAWSTAVTQYPQGDVGSLSPPGFAVGVDGTLYVTDAVPNTTQPGQQQLANGHLFAVDRAGNVLWSTPLGQDMYPCSNLAVGSGGVLYLSIQTAPGYSSAGNGSGAIVAYAPTGQLVWSVPQSEPGGCTALTVGPDGTLYASCTSSFDMFTPDAQAIANVFEPAGTSIVLDPDAGTETIVAPPWIFELLGSNYQGGWISPSGDRVGGAIVDGRRTIVSYYPDLPGTAGPLGGFDRSFGVLWSVDAGVPMAMAADGTIYACGAKAGACTTLVAVAP